MARITIISPEGRQERKLLRHSTLGRHPSNTVQVLDRIVSKEHCHIDEVDGRYVLIDLGSLNGTFVNGTRIERHILSEGDEIHIGATQIVFHAEVRSPSHTESTRVEIEPSRVSRSHTHFTVAPQEGVESHIRTRLAPVLGQTFLPESDIEDPASLRRDYEKLRASYEVMQAIGVELDVDRILERIIDAAFQLLPADRGVILLHNERDALEPRCTRMRGKRGDEGEAMELSRTILAEVLRDKAAIISNDVSMDERFQSAHSIIMQGIRSTMAVPLLHGNEVFGVMLLDSHIATHAFTEKDLAIFQNVANQAGAAIQNSLYAKKLEQEAITRQRFQKLLSPAIAEQVLEGKVEIGKSGELRETTVLFTDIRGFTAMSERQEPQAIVDMLNEYFELMVEIIFRHEGTLDKFVGDEIMALFGSPVAHQDDPFRAVSTAFEMIRVLRSFNEKRSRRGEDPIQVGIGINTGEVVAGYLGSSQALDYTVIGDAVNTGARLCSMAKGGEILISESTYRRVRDHFDVLGLPPAQLKGKTKALKVYRVIAQRGAPSTFPKRH